MCVIPARLKSTRLPHKPLLDICGLTMIERTYRRAESVLGKRDVYIATDEEKVKDLCSTFTNNIVMTSEQCLTGTDRVAEFASYIDADVYINLQGDEPIMPTGNIEKILEIAKKDPHHIHNGFAPIKQEYQFISRTVPKVVVTKSGKLMFMSRAPIPAGKSQGFKTGYKQICIYAFPKSTLTDFRYMEHKTENEEIEDIEILRFLENDYLIKMHALSPSTVAVDTYEDLELVRMIINAQGEGLPEYNC